MQVLFWLFITTKISTSLSVCKNKNKNKKKNLFRNQLTIELYGAKMLTTKIEMNNFTIYFFTVLRFFLHYDNGNWGNYISNIIISMLPWQLQYSHIPITAACCTFSSYSLCQKLCGTYCTRILYVDDLISATWNSNICQETCVNALGYPELPSA